MQANQLKLTALRKGGSKTSFDSNISNSNGSINRVNNCMVYNAKGEMVRFQSRSVKKKVPTSTANTPTKDEDTSEASNSSSVSRSRTSKLVQRLLKRHNSEAATKQSSDQMQSSIELKVFEPTSITSSPVSGLPGGGRQARSLSVLDEVSSVPPSTSGQD